MNKNKGDNVAPMMWGGSIDPMVGHVTPHGCFSKSAPKGYSLPRDRWAQRSEAWPTLFRTPSMHPSPIWSLFLLFLFDVKFPNNNET